MRDPGISLIASDGRWDDLRAAFRWPDWPVYNIADACCDAWARIEPGRIALRELRPDGEQRPYSYGRLSALAQRLANAFTARGIAREDRVAVLLPQCPEALITHLAAYRLGAIVVPLFSLFGGDGLRYRLADSGARAIVTDASGLEKIRAIRAELPQLETVFSIEGPESGVRGFWQDLEQASDRCAMTPTGPDDPAFLSYTSGTTGAPKGALHGHRCLIGHLPGIDLAHDGLGRAGDRIWSPADWAWLGGLTNVLLPSLHFGVEVVCHRMSRFDPERAVDLIERMGVRNTFFPPTALKLMRQGGVRAVRGLRSVTSAGEALGGELLDWGEGVFSTTLNEFYGQTECNAVLANCAARLPVRPGSAGRAVPGHEVAILAADGTICPPGAQGEIAIRAPDPAMFLRYWNMPGKTAEKFRGDWLLTGDEGVMDEDGYVFFRSRLDDIITSSGYRIGPTEIEDCLCGHPLVVMAGVVGVPDPIRTERVKAFVVLQPDAPRDGLEEQLVARVRQRISPHVAPREIVFVESLPMTLTGKIQRRLLRNT